jgi:large subunit ribosomal protein L21e
MPHKFYHGKTGRVFNVSPHAVGVVVNKQVRWVQLNCDRAVIGLQIEFCFRFCVVFFRNRLVEKRIHIRIEHVSHSKCRLDFLNRVKKNEVLKKEAKAKNQRVVTKRQVLDFFPVTFF